jgi:hypothetical protein
MSIEAKNWNIIAVGAWNVAILSPDGIRKRLFDLPDGTPVEIEVAIDKPGPFRVVHNNVIVAPTSKSLEILSRSNTIEGLKPAAEIAIKALQQLPETPLTAVGINFRYKIDVIPSPLIDLVKAPIDDLISDAGYVFKGNMIRRSIEHLNGVLNIEIVQGASLDGTINFNFHKDSVKPEELVGWLSQVEAHYVLAKSFLELFHITGE